MLNTIENAGVRVKLFCLFFKVVFLKGHKSKVGNGHHFQTPSHLWANLESSNLKSKVN